MAEIETYSLADVGLMTVAEAAELKGKGPRAVQRWIADGHLKPVALHVGVGGNRVMYLLKIKDVEAFEPRPPGAPEGNQFAKKDAPEERPKRGRKKKG
jgi:hypothetical protein